MKDDKNGTSTCKAGEEKYEVYKSASGKKLVQYDYRHTNGMLFSCVGWTLVECRKARKNWLLDIDPDAIE